MHTDFAVSAAIVVSMVFVILAAAAGSDCGVVRWFMAQAMPLFREEKGYKNKNNGKRNCLSRENQVFVTGVHFIGLLIFII